MPKVSPNDVALRSLQQARHYLTARNFGRAFAHFLVVFRLTPANSKNLRNQEDFIFALGQWGQELERQRKIQDLFQCYEQALELLPTNDTLQSNFGAHLFRVVFPFNFYAKCNMEISECKAIWETLVVRHFSRKIKNHSPTIAANILAVECGIKPAYLWDECSAMPKTVSEFLRDAKQAGLIREALRTMLVEEDVFVFSHESTLSSLISPFPLVDVSKSLEFPVLANSETVSGIGELLAAVVEQLRNSVDSLDVVRLETKPQWNLTTLFGALLNYPVVYWYDTSSEFGGDTCLSMIPLLVFRVTAKKWEIQHDLYSFSVPECLSGQLNGAVQSWFDQLKTRFESQKVYVDLNMEARTVTLPSVALLGFLDEAAAYFRQAILQEPSSVCARDYLDNIASALVERWHFPMLNCTTRNLAFQSAIRRAVAGGHRTVLDIGTGTGILSMLAVEAGAIAVHACEMSKAMHSIALETCASNNMKDKVHLMLAKSTDVEVPLHIPERVSLVITETFDAALFGEGILETLTHAWEELLIPVTKCDGAVGGRVIPAAATVWACPIECEWIRQYTRLSASQADLFGLSKIVLLMKSNEEEPYTTERLSELRGGYKKLSVPLKILEVNFNKSEELKELIRGKKFEGAVSCCDSGILDAVAVWFHLHLDDVTTISTSPDSWTCWEQAIYPTAHILPAETLLTEGASLSLIASYDRSFNLTPRIGSSSSTTAAHQDPERPANCIFVPGSELLALNDVTYQCSLHSALKSYLRRFQAPASVFINMSFPASAVLAMNLGAGKVGCLQRKFDPEVILQIIGAGGFDTNQICFETEETLLSASPSYDILVTDLVDGCGIIRPEVVCEITLMRECAMRQPFLIIPSKLRCVAVLIESDVLAERNYVTDDAKTLGFKVAEHINVFRVSHHQDLDLITLPHKKLSDPTVVLNLDFAGTDVDSASLVPSFASRTQTASTRVKTSGKLTAIAYWFELQVSEECVVSTMDEKTHWHQAAVVLAKDVSVEMDQTVGLVAQFSNGHLRIKLQE